MKRIALAFIRLYQLSGSAYMAPSCRFIPSCSNYGYHAIEKYGVFKGGWLAFKRLCRCHPFNEGGVDFVP